MIQDAAHVLRHDLTGSCNAGVIELDSDRGTALLDWAIDQRCVGLLVAAVSSGALVLTESVWAQLRSAQLRTCSVALALERLTLDTARRCQRLGVPFKVLKGVALASMVYPEPGWRDFGDVDLLLPADGFEDVVRSLELDGARRVYPSLGRSYERLIGKGVTMVTAEGWELDIHRTIVHGPWGARVDIDRLWGAEPETFQLGGSCLPTLSISEHLAHALLHASLGSSTPRSNSLRDVAQLQQSPECCRDRVLELLDGWAARAPAEWAAEQVSSATGVDMSWLSRGRPMTRTERRWLELHRRSPQPFRRLSLESLVLPIGARRRTALLVAMGVGGARSVASSLRAHRPRS